MITKLEIKEALLDILNDGLEAVQIQNSVVATDLNEMNDRLTIQFQILVTDDTIKFLDI